MQISNDRVVCAGDAENRIVLGTIQIVQIEVIDCLEDVFVVKIS